LDYSTQKSYIAVVGDEQDIVSLFREALTQIEGCTVFGFTEPEAALEHFIDNPQYYNLILTDFRMPEQNGIELLITMNQIKTSIKTLLMSAFGIRDEEIFQQCKKKQKYHKRFLQKPIALSDLINEVKNQLGNIECFIYISIKCIGEANTPHFLCLDN
jgi:DNA-binding NtrC family response regulator